MKTPSGGFTFLFVHERFGLSWFGGRAVTGMNRPPGIEARRPTIEHSWISSIASAASRETPAVDHVHRR